MSSANPDDAQAAPGSTPALAPTSTPALAPTAAAPAAEADKDDEKKGALDTIKDKLAAALPSVVVGAAKKAGHEAHEAAQQVERVKDVKVGSLGILHPSVLKAYELDYPASTLEFDVEPFL